MFVNVLNADDLKAYVKAVAYGNGDEIVLTADKLKDLDFITENRDMIIRAMVAQFIKKRLEEHLKKSENVSFLTPVTEGDTLPDWAQNTLARGEKLYRFNSKNIPRDLTEQIGGVRDYLYSVAMEDVDNKIRAGKKKTSAEEKPYIYLDALKRRYPTWEDANERSQQWHQELAERLKAEADLKESLAGAEFVMDLSGGLKAYRLRTPGALDYESDHMGHCVGRGGYDEGVENGTIEIYSIRDEKGEPHATFEVKDGKIIQCKGKENRPPVKKYWPAVRKFVEHMNFSFEYTRDMNSMGFLKQDGQIYNVYDLVHGFPDGFTIKGDLDLEYLDVSDGQYPDLSGVSINGKFYVPQQATTLKGWFPKSVGELSCRGTKLTSVVIPDGVTKIGYDAFKGCSNLTSIKIPDSVTKIGEWAFEGCTSLQSIVIPSGVTEIGQYAFYGCSSLTSATIPDSVTKIEEGAFWGCTSLQSIVIPDSVTEIGYYAFYGCSSLTSLHILKGVRKIGEGAFEGCTSLTTLHIPSSVTKIEEGAFMDCEKLTITCATKEQETMIRKSGFKGPIKIAPKAVSQQPNVVCTCPLQGKVSS